jgi:hypothetical protein
VFLTNYFGDQIKKDEISRSYGTYGKEEKGFGRETYGKDNT